VLLQVGDLLLAVEFGRLALDYFVETFRRRLALVQRPLAFLALELIAHLLFDEFVRLSLEEVSVFLDHLVLKEGVLFLECVLFVRLLGHLTHHGIELGFEVVELFRFGCEFLLELGELAVVGQIGLPLLVALDLIEQFVLKLIFFLELADLVAALVVVVSQLLDGQSLSRIVSLHAFGFLLELGELLVDLFVVFVQHVQVFALLVEVFDFLELDLGVSLGFEFHGLEFLSEVGVVLLQLLRLTLRELGVLGALGLDRLEVFVVEFELLTLLGLLAKSGAHLLAFALQSLVFLLKHAQSVCFLLEVGG